MPALKVKTERIDKHYRFVYGTLGTIYVYSTRGNHNLITSFNPGPLDTEQDLETAIAWWCYENAEV